METKPRFTREELIARFAEPTAVLFTKVNGETSVMTCTLNPQFMPAIEPPLTEDKTPVRQRTPNPDIIHVYSLDRQGWRSFRVENVIALGEDVLLAMVDESFLAANPQFQPQ